jgi:hypothetical protein
MREEFIQPILGGIRERYEILAEAWDMDLEFYNEQQITAWEVDAIEVWIYSDRYTCLRYGPEEIDPFSDGQQYLTSEILLIKMERPLRPNETILEYIRDNYIPQLIEYRT